MIPALTGTQLREFICLFEYQYPNFYGYTGNLGTEQTDGTLLYYLFRNREESFNKSNAVAIISYRE